MKIRRGSLSLGAKDPYVAKDHQDITGLGESHHHQMAGTTISLFLHSSKPGAHDKHSVTS